MREALRDFTDHVRDADIAVESFAGHGIELNGTNYLIPVGAVLKRDIEPDTIQLWAPLSLRCTSLARAVVA
jgi:uncharacterized caspase-like protein